MPKYFDFMVCGYFLYFTSHCVVEAMHVHANKHKLIEDGSAKFFVKSNGDTIIEKKGILNERVIREIQGFIKRNYEVMFEKWQSRSTQGFFAT